MDILKSSATFADLKLWFYVGLLLLVIVLSLLTSIFSLYRVGQLCSGISIFDPDVKLLSSGMRMRKWFISITAIANGVQFSSALAEFIIYIMLDLNGNNDASSSYSNAFISDAVKNKILVCRLVPSILYTFIFGMLAAYIGHISYSLKAVRILVLAGKAIGDAAVISILFSVLLLAFFFAIRWLKFDMYSAYFTLFYCALVILMVATRYSISVLSYVKANNFLLHSRRLLERYNFFASLYLFSLFAFTFTMCIQIYPSIAFRYSYQSIYVNTPYFTHKSYYSFIILSTVAFMHFL